MPRSSFYTALAAFAAGVVCLGTLYVGFIGELSEDEAIASTLEHHAAIPAANRPLDHRLHPSKLMSKIGDLEFSSSWKNDYNVVHVINTQFLAHQQDLSHLAEARLDLFKTFTLPSMRGQSNNQFLWLIWTDRNLAETLKKQLVDLVNTEMPNHNVVVLGASQDDHLNMRKLYGHEWLSLSKKVIAGDAKVLADYHQASKSHLLLETRLDADDALSETFVDSMQIQASVTIGRDETAKPGKMEIFCPESHVEWRYYSPDEDDQDAKDREDDGTLVHYHNKNFCVNSGLTQVFNVEIPSFLDAAATFRGRKLQDNTCSVYEHNLNNCEVTQTFQDCGSSRHLAEVFFGPRKDRRRRKNKNTGIRNGGDDRFLSILDQADPTNGNGVCQNATQIPEPAATFFSTLNVRNPNNCKPGSFACRTLNYTAMTMNIDDKPESNIYIDGVMTQNDVAVLKNENGYVSECTPVNCDTDRVYLQIVAQTGTYGTIQDLNVEIVQQSIPMPWGGFFTIDQIEIYYKNLTTDSYFDESAACSTLFTEVAADGGIAGANAINLPQDEFQAAERELQRDIQCSNTEMAGVAICVAPTLYREECECVRKLRLLPDETPDGDIIMTPLKASVLMSKTPTAAGMKNVLPDTKGGGENSVKMNTYKTKQDRAWKEMEAQFGVSQKSVNELRARLDGNMESILVDAFAGQCTPGHSCKEAAKRSLGQLINKVQHNKYHKNKKH